MSALRESEIFAKLKECFSEAASLCDQIAIKTLRGKNYTRLIVVCKEIEGACRQAGHYRENIQWMVLGNDVIRLQGMYGNWLRENTSLANKAKSKELFRKAALKMRELGAKAEHARTKAHGRLGAILPVDATDTLRQRAVQVPAMSKGGVYLTSGATLQ